MRQEIKTCFEVYKTDRKSDIDRCHRVNNPVLGSVFFRLNICWRDIFTSLAFGQKFPDMTILSQDTFSSLKNMILFRIASINIERIVIIDRKKQSSPGKKRQKI